MLSRTALSEKIDKCVTKADEFQALCLNKAALDNVLIGLHDSRGDPIDKEQIAPIVLLVKTIYLVGVQKSWEGKQKSNTIMCTLGNRKHVPRSDYEGKKVKRKCLHNMFHILLLEFLRCEFVVYLTSKCYKNYTRESKAKSLLESRSWFLMNTSLFRLGNFVVKEVF